MVTEDQKNYILKDTVVVCNMLRDNLELIKEMGLNSRKLSKCRFDFNKELTVFLTKVFNQSEDELRMLSTEIDQSSEIMRKLSVMSFEEKEQVKSTL